MMALSQSLRAYLEELPARWLAQLSSLPGAAYARLRALLPKTVLHWLSIVLVWTVFLVFAHGWVTEHQRLLFDPAQQNDDAQTSLFGFHAFAKEPLLENDPFAKEMRSFMPPAIQALYFVCIRLTDLYTASKIVQNIAILVLVAAGVYLMLKRRAGLAAGLLVIFFCLYTFFIKHRIDGGLARAFAFPAFMWWTAGALVSARRPRWFAASLAALFYPPSLAIVLAAEGLFTLSGAARRSLHDAFKRLRGYAVLVLACALLVAPAVVGLGPDRGPIHTLEQAKEDGAFHRSGRLKVLPLEDPAKTIGEYLVTPFARHGKPLTDWLEHYKDYGEAIAVCTFAILLIFVLFGLSPLPRAFLAILCGSSVLYLLSLVFAFRLYSPTRYTEYGAAAAGVALAVGSVGLLSFRSRVGVRAPIRNAAAAALMAFILIFVGDGNTWTDCCIDRNDQAKLWNFIRTLPKNARFAGHLKDVDGIPYWAGRSTTGGYETMQPWFVEAWQRQKKQAKQTLSAMYAVEEEELFSFAEKYGVTHLLVNSRRYRTDFKKKARTFQPISAFTDKLLRGRQRDDLVLARVPRSAVLFKTGRLRVISVAKLRDALRRN